MSFNPSWERSTKALAIRGSAEIGRKGGDAEGWRQGAGWLLSPAGHTPWTQREGVGPAHRGLVLGELGLRGAGSKRKTLGF